MARIRYLQRVLQAYLGRKSSQLTFWHETPTINGNAFSNGQRQFYMTFEEKAHYPGSFDKAGIPLLDYRGHIGPQYNPIAIAQYGLGCYNLYKGAQGEDWKRRFLSTADWLVENLRENSAGQPVWFHDFDWEYFRLLKAPWYSGLAQGQGIALLVRAFWETGGERYREAAARAFQPLVRPLGEGGTLFVDAQGDWWIEEYVTSPPTHILNGFIWALWGVYDYRKITSDPSVQELWDRGTATVAKHLARFDLGHWSRYDLAPTRLPNVASHFYHDLHLVQLEVMARLTGNPVFAHWLERWDGYKKSTFSRRRAWVEKAVFKLLYF